MKDGKAAKLKQNLAFADIEPGGSFHAWDEDFGESHRTLLDPAEVRIGLCGERIGIPSQRSIDKFVSEGLLFPVQPVLSKWIMVGQFGHRFDQGSVFRKNHTAHVGGNDRRRRSWQGCSVAEGCLSEPK